MNQQDLHGIAPNSISHGRRATPAGVPGHDVQFYDSEDFLVREVARFLAEGIRAGQPLIIVATQAHRRQFASAYAMGNFYKEEHTASFQRICAQHGVRLRESELQDLAIEAGARDHHWSSRVG